MPFCDDDHHVFTNSKYYSINELNALQIKQKNLSILYLNIGLLDKHIDDLPNAISLTKFSFRVTDFSEYKVAFLNYQYLWLYPLL